MPFACSWKCGFDGWCFNHHIGPRGWGSQPRVERQVSWKELYSTALRAKLPFHLWSPNLQTSVRTEINGYLGMVSLSAVNASPT